MRTGDGKRLCQEAQVYYYDLLNAEGEGVPESVRQHVATCPACRKQMHRLRKALFESEQHADSADSGDDETIGALARQFQLLDEPVTCGDVKAFLPDLGAAVPPIRVPTPVTVHVDHCPQCAGDLAALRELGLTTDQLKRLGRFFRSDDSEEAPESSQTRLRPDGLTARSFGPMACRDIGKADIFDCVIPFGLSQDERQKAIAAHVRSCPECMEKVRTLQRVIGGIIERADSETATIYHARSEAPAECVPTNNAYPYPIDVEVLHREPDFATDEADFSTFQASGEPRLEYADVSGDRRASHLGSLAKMAVLALVLAALPVLHWANVPTASGTIVDDVLKSLDQAQNVQIVAKDQDSRLIQEFWVARRSNLLVVRTTRERVLYDLNRRVRKTIEMGEAAGQPVELTEREYNRVRQLMVDCLRDAIAPVSPEAKLHAPGTDFGEVAEGSFDIYEKTWAPRTGNSSLRRGWRGYLDPKTGLPQRTEFYQERRDARRGETYWQLQRTTVFTYLAQEQMDEKIRTAFPAR